ncbi:hypothetical protein [Wukongibacter sp. M2B1]|uniref:hypothetical protein n=1 Tax=Wukongibacter sp. M2B1 TaxID=3088895 RepID=UPI003D7C0338
MKTGDVLKLIREEKENNTKYYQYKSRGKIHNLTVETNGRPSDRAINDFAKHALEMFRKHFGCVDDEDMLLISEALGIEPTKDKGKVIFQYVFKVVLGNEETRQTFLRNLEQIIDRLKSE